MRRSSWAFRRWFRCSIRPARPTPQKPSAGIGSQQAPVKRYVLWFNGNGIPERYWIPTEEGVDYDMTPCLSPIARLRDDVLVLSGLDNTHGGNGHPQSLCALMTCTPLTSNGPAAASVDQLMARKNRRHVAVPFAADRRVAGIIRRSSAEEHELGGSEPAAAARGDSAPFVRSSIRRKDQAWINDKTTHTGCHSTGCGVYCASAYPRKIEIRLDEHLSSIRDLERAIVSLPPEYKKVTEPEQDFDLKDWPRIAKLQSDLLAYALATGQTRVASYMLTKCQGLARFPWLGHTAARHHDYTHKDGKAPGERAPKGSGSCAISAAGTWRSSLTWSRS